MQDKYPLPCCAFAQTPCKLLFIFIFVLGHLLVLRDHDLAASSWQGSGGPCGVPGMELRSATCKVNACPPPAVPNYEFPHTICSKLGPKCVDGKGDLRGGCGCGDPENHGGQDGVRSGCPGQTVPAWSLGALCVAGTHKKSRIHPMSTVQSHLVLLVWGTDSFIDAPLPERLPRGVCLPLPERFQGQCVCAVWGTPRKVLGCGGSRERFWGMETLRKV